MDKLRRLFRDTSAATAVEYGLIAAIISLSLILGLEEFRDGLLAVFELVTTNLSKA